MDTAERVCISLQYSSSSKDPLTPTEALCPPPFPQTKPPISELEPVLFNTFTDAAEKGGKSGPVFSAKGDYEEI